MKLIVPDSVLTIEPYVPGKPIEALEREYGIRDSVKLASNENPLGPPASAVAAAREALARLHRYPDGDGHELTAALSRHFGVPTRNIVLGNGSDDIIGMLTRAFLRPGDQVVIPRPSFLMYDIMTRAAGAEPVYVPLKQLTVDLEAIVSQVTSRTRMVFVTNPNNPTGTIVTRAAFSAFIDALPPEVVVVVDEAYIEFVRNPDCLQSIALLSEERPVVTLRTFSKLYGLAGLRIGYGIMPSAIAEILHRVRQPFTTNTPAQAAARAALADDAYVQRTLAVVHEGLDYLYAALKSLGLTAFPTEANFLMIDVGRSADEVFEALLHAGVIVRSMRSYGYPRYIRISVGLAEENRRLIDALGRLTAGGTPAGDAQPLENAR